MCLRLILRKLSYAFLLLVCSTCVAHTRHRKQIHFLPDTRLFVPSRASQIAQNVLIDSLSLERVRDDGQLHRMVGAGELVTLQSSLYLKIDGRLPASRRYVRPWVNDFLLGLSVDFFANFQKPFVITSAVRTVSVQRRLLRWNRNAAAYTGETASSHLSGATVDIARRSMTPAENRWMEDVMFEYAVRNRVIVEEENGQKCWHIMVLPKRTDVLCVNCK